MAIDLTELGELMDDAAGTAVSTALADLASGGITGVLSGDTLPDFAAFEGFSGVSSILSMMDTFKDMPSLEGLSDAASILSTMDTFKDLEPFGGSSIANFTSGLSVLSDSVTGFNAIDGLSNIQAGLAEFATAGLLNSVKPFIDNPMSGFLQTIQPVMEQSLVGFASQLEPIFAGITTRSFLGGSTIGLAASAFAGLDLAGSFSESLAKAGLGSPALSGLRDLDFLTPSAAPSPAEVTELPMSAEVGRYNALIETQLLTVSVLERISTQLEEISTRPPAVGREGVSPGQRLVVAGFVVAIIAVLLQGVELFI